MQMKTIIAGVIVVGVISALLKIAEVEILAKLLLVHIAAVDFVEKEKNK